jgi:hypothetical protein
MQGYMLELAGRERMADHLREAERAGLAARARRAAHAPGSVETEAARTRRPTRGRVAPTHRGRRATA